MKAGVVALAAASCASACAPALAQGPGAVHVFLDASQSMAGYVRPGFAAKPIGDLVVLMNGGAGGARPTYWCFGDGVAPLADPTRLATPAGYAGKGPPGCGNLNSRVDLALQAVRAKTDRALSVIVTDLWLDSGAFVGTPAVGLGVPLAGLLKDGRAVAVVGVRSRFEGTVYGVPGAGNFKGAKERPLFLVVIGPRDRVSGLVAALRDSGSPSFQPAAMRVALFTGNAPPVRARTPIPRGGGVTPAPTIQSGVPAFVMDRDLAGRAGQAGRLEGDYTAGAGLPPGSVWAGPPRTRTQAWVRRGKAWAPLVANVPAWSKIGPTSARFSLSAKATAALPGRNTYWLRGEIGTAGLSSPNPAAQWMRDWSLKPGKPGAFVGALELGTLAGILENAAAASGPAFRPTSRFDITVEIDE